MQGTGAIGTGVIGGTIARGNSIGTIHVSGNYIQLPGPIYEVEISSTGSSDRIAIDGQANIQGDTVSVIPSVGDYSIGTHYTILTASGGRKQRYLDELVRNFASFCDTAITQNQCATDQGRRASVPITRSTVLVRSPRQEQWGGGLFYYADTIGPSFDTML